MFRLCRAPIALRGIARVFVVSISRTPQGNCDMRIEASILADFGEQGEKLGILLLLHFHMSGNNVFIYVLPGSCGMSKMTYKCGKFDAPPMRPNIGCLRR